MEPDKPEIKHLGYHLNRDTSHPSKPHKRSNTMDRSPPTHWQGASFEVYILSSDAIVVFLTLTHQNAFHASQQQQSTRALHPPTRRHSIASYQPALPSESRMPDEWGYPSQASSMPHVSSAPYSRKNRITHNTLALIDIPRNLRGAAAPTIPNCRYLNCHRPVTRDEKTHELTEYCSPEHMRFVVLFLQGPPCSCSCCWT